MKPTIPLLLLVAVSACTTPADVTQPLSNASDKNAEFKVNDTASGLAVELRYSRYQFVPETDALLTACRSMLTARTYEEAKNRNRTIEPIDDQQIRVSTGRNIIKGRTSCRAFVEARWKAQP